MKCKDCKDTMCNHRTTDAEKECIFEETITATVTQGYCEDVINRGLRFENGRIYTVEEHRNPDKGTYEIKVDVTDELKRILK